MPIARIICLALLVASCKKEQGAPPATVAPQGSLTFAYVDVAASMGYLARNRSGKDGIKEFILEAMPPGIAVADYDGDGWMDMYCPNGNDIVTYDPDLKSVTLLPTESEPHDALYWNRGGTRFEEGAAAAGVDDALWSFGAIAGDVDNDGDPDIYLCNWGPNRLYLNEGGRKFRDAAAETHCTGDPRDWSTGACFFDYDRDGDLDLYVAQYADVYEFLAAPNITRVGPDKKPHGRSCDWKGLKVYCGPLGLRPLNDVLFRNLLVETGKLDFQDVSRESGIWLKESPKMRTESSQGPYYGFQPVAWDLTGDGWVDFFVANDSVPNSCWINQRDGTFRDEAHQRSLAMSMSDFSAQASMGVGLGDINGDGVQDLVVTNFSHDQFNLLLGRPDGTFDEKADKTGFREMSFSKLGWGTILFDPDNDMDLDIFCACGHVYPEVDGFPNQETTYRQTNLLVLNERGAKGRLKLRNVSADAGPGLQIAKCSRAAVRIDFDNDGDLDLATSELNDSPCLLRCDLDRATSPAHSIQVRLYGDPSRKVPLDPAGAFVTVTAGGVRQTQVFLIGSSFLSSEDPRMHFGLAGNDTVESIEILWPNGETGKVTGLKADQRIEIAYPGLLKK